MTTSPAPTPQELGFTASLNELEGIVAALESERLDVDVLGQQVERAAQLVEFCRGELDATKLNVTQILERLAPPESGDSASASGDDATEDDA